MSTPEDVADVIRRADLTAKRWEEIGVNRSRYWNSEDICLAAHFVRYLHDELASQRATIERLEREMLAWRICAQDMTPGGSEFMTPDAVRGYQRDFKNRYHAAKCEAARLRKDRNLISCGLTAISEADEATPASTLRALARAALSPTTASATTGEVGRGN